MWFSLFACAAAAAGLGSTELARRRTERLGPDSVAGGLLVAIVAIGAATVAMATAHAFALVAGAYIAISVLRPVLDPLLSGWMVTRIEPSVRATALSAKDMFDSAGQIAGGPVIGVIGTPRLDPDRAAGERGRAGSGGCLRGRGEPPHQAQDHRNRGGRRGR